MITREECKALIDVAIKHGVRKKADGVEVSIKASNVATSRFANNGMTQNQSPQCVTVSVRALKDGKQARLTSDVTKPEGIRQLVENALRCASFLEPDKDLLPLVASPKRQSIREVNRYHARTASYSAADRAKAIAAIVDVAKRNDLIAAGVFASGANVVAIGNSAGLFRYHRETHAEVSITMLRVDPVDGSESTGWAKADSPKVTDIDAEGMARLAAQKAIASARPMDIEPGRYTVVLEPAAVLDLVSFLWSDFTGTSHVDKLSCFASKVGTRVLGQNINIADDAYHPLQAGAPFDGEGNQRQVLQLVENGTIGNLVMGRRSAEKLKAEPTGHGLEEPSAEGEMPLNLVLQGGSVSLDEMIRSTKRGILLTRVWYVREVDPTLKIETGMTRDGTFLIEDGAITGGVKNLRFNQGLIEMLNNVSAIGPAGRTAGEEGFPAVVPPMQVERFNFTSVTRF
jgi:PmbA protein